MGDFRITIEGVGNHGCGREAKDGEVVKRCDQPGCVDCRAVAFVQALKAEGALYNGSAKLEHWPVPGAAGTKRNGQKGQEAGPIDDLLTGIRTGAFVLATLLLCGSLWAQAPAASPEPSASPSPVASPAAGSSSGGSQTTTAPDPALDAADVCLKASADFVVGSGSTTTVPGVRLEGESPLPFPGSFGDFRGYAQANLSGAPGTASADILSSPQAVRSASFQVGAGYRLAYAPAGEQLLQTEVYVQYGFTTAYGSSGALLARNPRTWGAGVRIAERKSKTWISVIYGRDERAGDWGYGQLIAAAEVPLTAAQGAVWFGADATLSVGHPAGVAQTDFVAVHTGVAIPELVSVLSHKPTTSAALDKAKGSKSLLMARHAPPRDGVGPA